MLKPNDGSAGLVARKQLLPALIAFLAFLILSSHLSAQKSKEPFYTQTTRAVIRLEHYEDIKKEGQTNPSRVRKSDGTGFFVLTPDALFVVTAAHVARKDYDLHARVPVLLDPTGETMMKELKLPRSRWVFHPDIGDEETHPVDVAVMKLPPLSGAGVVAFRYCPQNCPEDEYNQLEKDPDPPQEVLVFGFPLNIGFQLREPRPMGRQGMVALKADERFLVLKGKYVEAKAFLMDIKMFGGNSGSPILTMPGLGRKMYLFGLVFGTNVNLDFAIGEPASRIREVLDQARNQSIAFQAWDQLN